LAETWRRVLFDIVNDTSPQLGGNLDLNEKGIQYDWLSLASDHTYSGDIIAAVAGEGVTIGEVCYLKSDGKFWQTDADAEATSKGMLAMATATINASATGIFLIRGLIRDDTWNWSAGAELYLSVTKGAISASKPTGNADIVRIIGYAKHADYVWFDPDKSYYEVTT